MNYQKITPAIIEELKTIFGSSDVLLSHESLEKYSYDESSVNPHFPEVVVFAEYAEEVSRLMKPIPF